jgi:hypothetical protein
VSWTVVLVAAVAVALASPAGATVFDIGKPETVGKFKVLGGHYKQTVGYLANYKLETADRCWVYNYSDTGSARYNLKFDKGQVDRWKWTGHDMPMLLFVDGTASRSWNGTVNVTEGPEDDRDQCSPASPGTDNNRSCGSAKIKDEATNFSLLPVKNGRFSPGAPDAAPFGPILRRDPFRAHGGANCPSTSTYGLIAIPGIANNGMKELDGVKPGQEVTLKGKADESGPDETLFIHIGDWVTGTHTAAEVNWELELRRVK